jgi:hypothetical protein
MINEASNLLVPRGNPTAPRVVLRSQAYALLMRAIRICTPSAAAGALTGTVRRVDGLEWVTVEAAQAVGLTFTPSGLALDFKEWRELKSQLRSARNQEMDIVGWYYASPDLDFSNPGIDLAQAQQTLLPDARLLLLVDPSAEQGVFCTWHEGNLVSTGGFYEALPQVNAPPIVPWTGQLPGLSDAPSPVSPEATGAQPDSAPGAAIEPTGVWASLAVPPGRSTRAEEPFAQTALPAGRETATQASTMADSNPTVADAARESGREEIASSASKGRQTKKPAKPAVALPLEATAIEAASRVEPVDAARSAIVGSEVPLPGGQDEDDRAALFDAGLAAYQSDDWLRAQQLLARLVRQQPDYERHGQQAARLLDLTMLFGSGMAAYQRGEWAEARQALEHVVGWQPDYERHSRLAVSILADIDRLEAGSQATGDPLAAYAMLGQVDGRRPVSADKISAPIKAGVAVLGLLGLFMLALLAVSPPRTPAPATPPNQGGASKSVTTPVAEVLPLTSESTPTPAASGTRSAPSPTGSLRPPSPTAGQLSAPTAVSQALLNHVAAAEAALRTGQFDVSMDSGGGSRSTSRVWFDLGDSSHDSRFRIVTAYEGRVPAGAALERVLVGNRAWQRGPNGKWALVPGQEAAREQLQAYLPHATAAPDPRIGSAGESSTLTWYDAPRNIDVTLQVDPATGVPRQMKQVTRKTGSTLIVNYTGWNTPVEIVPPAP